MNLCRTLIAGLAISLAVPQQTTCSSATNVDLAMAVAAAGAIGITLGGITLGIVSLGSAAAPRVIEKIYSYVLPAGKKYTSGTIKDTFACIAGKENVKEELTDIIDYLRNPTKYTDMGAKVPKGLLMYGPPGTGKTSLARAVAGEASCSFIALTGSELNGNSWMDCKQLVQALCRWARRHSPCIIFIDEIDALYAQKQLLTEMDGFEAHKEVVIIIGSTNLPQKLHEGLLRPGRFDRIVKVDLPNVIDRKKILEMYTKKVKIDTSIDLDIIAQITVGFSGADVANLVNEATIIALHNNKACVDQADLEEAYTKITSGKPDFDKAMTPEERHTLAYHEAGHALAMALLADKCDPLHTVTIVSREQAAGTTSAIPILGIGKSKEQLMAELVVLYGGLAAEYLVFRKITTGARSDLQQAKNLAEAMVCTYCMSDKIGPILLPSYDSCSNETRQLIEQEINTFLLNAYNSAYAMLNENRAKLDCIAQALLAKETLSAKEVHALLGTKESAPASQPA